MKRHSWLAILLTLLVAHSATAALSGLRTVGAPGDYNSIGAAIADIQTQTLDGPLILELEPNYSSAVETFPIIFTNLTTTADNTLTIRPSPFFGGIRVITSANTTAATIDLNGAQYVTIDGHAGGVGTDRLLTIANTSVSGVALRFINGASNNIIRGVNIQGANNNVASGVVLFSTNSGTGGNSDNLIDDCVIRDSFFGTPVNTIYSLGNTTSTNRYNRDNTVNNCSLINFYANNTDVAGIRLDGGNTDWTITGNSFYQTNSARGGFAGFIRPIYINNTNFGNNFTVTGNYIGGSAVHAGGTNWATASLGANYQFVGIQLNVATNTPSSVQGNSISNFLWQSASTAFAPPGVWSGIYVSNGAVDIGTVTGNLIGQDTGTNAVSVTTLNTAGTIFGIASDSRYGVNIMNNSIGSMSVKGNSTSVSISLVGIQVNAGTNVIAGNLVGSLTSSNSLNAPTAATGAGQFVTGILSASAGSSTISNNTVANLYDGYVGSSSSGQVRGIVTTAGINTITDNTVRDLLTLSVNTGTSSSAAVIGISQTSTGAGQTVSRNRVHSLLASSGPIPNSVAVSVTGIYYSGGNNAGNVVARNFVHSLAIFISSSSSSALNGLQFDGGNLTVQNNMVDLGRNADGFSTASLSIIRAIFDNSSTARNFYYNSAYISGLQTSGSAGSIVFSSFGTGRDLRNNIFFNARNRGASTGNSYAISLSNTNTLTCDANIYYVNGTGGVLGRFNSADRTTLAAWQTVTAVDASSIFADPLFVTPTGTADSLDMHLQAGNPAAGAAQPVAGVTDDFDGEIRSHIAPDIGADETVSPNNAPVAGDPFTLVVELGVTKSVAIVGGTNAPSDVDGDPLTITDVTGSPDSVVSTDGTNVFFTGLTGDTGSFTYTVSDDRGATASQTVDVVILPSTIPGYGQMTAISTAGGTNQMNFLGTPSFQYALDVATNLDDPVDWLPQTTNTAGMSGWIFFTNTPDGFPAFYRTRFVP